VACHLPQPAEVALPFQSGAKISRSLWVLFIGEWGVWPHAVLPVDDSLGIPDDEEDITGLCDLVGSFIGPSACHENEKAMVVLRRPEPTEISMADAYIFRLVRRPPRAAKPRTGRSMWLDREGCWR
jgi:hypothetical protein